MSVEARNFSPYATDAARQALQNLLMHTNAPAKYQETMTKIGQYLGQALERQIPSSAKCLVASTAEDADFLSKGIIDVLANKHCTKAAVFWNNHYSIPGGSVAPVVHKFLQPGFEETNALIVVKSVISGSCVVRTNILELIERLRLDVIYIVSPVMHTKAEISLRSEFPRDISDKFQFVYFAIDSEKDATGEVKPGIGGQIYQLLGMNDQPAKTSFMPELVRKLAFG